MTLTRISNNQITKKEKNRESKRKKVKKGRRRGREKEKHLVPISLKTIDALQEKGTVVDFKHSTLFLLMRVDVEGRAAIKGYDAGVDIHPFKLYRR